MCRNVLTLETLAGQVQGHRCFIPLYFEKSGMCAYVSASIDRNLYMAN